MFVLPAASNRQGNTPRQRRVNARRKTRDYWAKMGRKTSTMSSRLNSNHTTPRTGGAVVSPAGAGVADRSFIGPLPFFWPGHEHPASPDTKKATTYKTEQLAYQ